MAVREEKEYPLIIINRQKIDAKWETRERVLKYRLFLKEIPELMEIPILMRGQGRFYFTKGTSIETPLKGHHPSL